MLLSPKYSQPYYQIETDQGQHLKKYLRRHLRKSGFWSRELALGPLGLAAGGLLNAHNGFARGRWFRALAGAMCEELDAAPPRFLHQQPVYFLTVTDARQLVYPDQEPSGPTLPEIRASYAQLLNGLNFIGMLDPALYVSAYRTHHVTRFILYHVHGLVWGMGPDEIEVHCQRIRRTTKALLPYATPVKCTAITPGTLLKVISYIIKMPRHQYQLAARPNATSLQQWKRSLNGINSVRLYRAMEDVTLDQLVLTGGSGAGVLEKMLEDLSGWRARRSAVPAEPEAYRV